MIVIDRSVFVNLLAPRDQARHKMAEEIFRLVERLDLAIYAPRLMEEHEKLRTRLMKVSP